MSIPEGPPGGTPGNIQAATQYRYQFHSDENAAGKQSVLVSLVNLWNKGYTSSGGSMPMVSATMCRWQTLNLLRLFVYRRENPGVAVGSSGEILDVPELPTVFKKFWRGPRLSTVGIDVGSLTVKNKAKHIDIDWFGPPGSGEGCNWWAEEVDGAAVELLTAKKLIRLLEQGVGVKQGGFQPGEWELAGEHTHGASPECARRLARRDPRGAYLPPRGSDTPPHRMVGAPQALARKRGNQGFPVLVRRRPTSNDTFHRNA